MNPNLILNFFGTFILVAIGVLSIFILISVLMEVFYENRNRKIMKRWKE